MIRGAEAEAEAWCKCNSTSPASSSEVDEAFVFIGFVLRKSGTGDAIALFVILFFCKKCTFRFPTTDKLRGQQELEMLGIVRTICHRHRASQGT
jgi:hypothetical protein